MRRRLLSFLLTISLVIPSMSVMAKEPVSDSMSPAVTASASGSPTEVMPSAEVALTPDALPENPEITPEASAEVSPLESPPHDNPVENPVERPVVTPMEIPAGSPAATPTEITPEAPEETPEQVPAATPAVSASEAPSEVPLVETPTESPFLEDELLGAVNLVNDSNANFTNLVVFVEFQDTKDHSTHKTGCMRDTALNFEYFDGDGRYNSKQSRRSLKRYLDTVSYGQLRVANIFPQYNGTEIVPMQMKYNSDHYNQNDTALIDEIVAGLQQYNFSGINLDRWMSDGRIDNIAVVVAAGGADFIAHEEIYIGTGQIGGVRVGNYTILPEKGVYLEYGSTGEIIHEFLHVLGYKDLYRKRGITGKNMPVGHWDIMATAGGRPQYPLAWARSVFTGWFNIPTVTSSVKGCSLYAASSTTAATKDQQALILKTDYSDTEFFVVEFRKQGKSYDGPTITDELECSLPGSGLIIYRINTRYEANVGDLPDMIYVFRPGDTYDSYGNEYGNGDLLSSFLSAESGRTFYGSTDPAKGLTDGAITYADGSNSGIVIGNVGSAGGDQITFDITFTDNSDYWKLISTEQDNNDTSTAIASCLDDDGTMYYLQTKSNGTYLYSYKSSWNRLGAVPAGWNHQLVKFRGSLYAGYLDRSFKVRLARWNGTGWEDISIGQYEANEVSMAAGQNGIYMSWASTDNSRVFVYEYDGSRVKALGVAGTESGAANPVVCTEGENVAVMYRIYTDNDRLIVKYYNRASDTWGMLPDAGFAGSGILRIDGGKVYVLKNDKISGDNYGICVYIYDLNRNGGTWEQLGNRIGIIGNSVEMDLCFQQGHPYIAFMEGKDTKFDTSVMHLVGGQWRQLGNRLVNGTIQGLRIFSFGDEIWATYGSGVSGVKAYIKAHASRRPAQPVPTGRPIEPTPVPPGPGNPTPTPVPPVVPTSGPVIPTPAPGVSPTPTPNLPITWPFADLPVQPGWKYESVKFVYENGIMNGITQPDGTVSSFEPDSPLTREMFATVLYRMEGNPAVVFENRFSDVGSGKYYSNAVIWAYQKNIVNGYADGTFGVGEFITREQIAKMLMEYADRKGYDITASADISGFPDVSQVSGWAVRYMKWAVGSGMINGQKSPDGQSFLNARGNATRAECAAMLMRFIQRYQ